MELWMAVLGAALLVGGVVVGAFYGRYHAGGARKAEDLQQQLDESKDKFEEYQQDVNQHFRTTAELVNAMTASYRAVYEHLAASSAKLCPNEPTMLRLAEPTEKLLKYADPAQVPSVDVVNNTAELANNGENSTAVVETEVQTDTPVAEPVVDQRIYH